MEGRAFVPRSRDRSVIYEVFNRLFGQGEIFCNLTDFSVRWRPSAASHPNELLQIPQDVSCSERPMRKVHIPKSDL